MQKPISIRVDCQVSYATENELAQEAHKRSTELADPLNYPSQSNNSPQANNDKGFDVTDNVTVTASVVADAYKIFRVIDA